MYASFAREVVFPVPLIPTNRIKNGCPLLFFAFINSKRSIFPALSKREEMLAIRLFLTNCSISFLATLEPTNLFFKSVFMESITSLATSDSSKDISKSKRICSMSFSLSSFSPKLLAALENALRSFSNIVLT